jgi:hypothetical protein
MILNAIFEHDKTPCKMKHLQHHPRLTKAESIKSYVTLATGHTSDKQCASGSCVTKNTSDTSKTVTPQLAYAMHILNNRHEYGPMHNTMELLKQINKTKFIVPYEQLYIQSHHHHK